jgi:hypothetical protein
MVRARLALAGVVVVVGTSIGGCGSGSKPLTTTAFIRQGNAVCMRANRQFPLVTDRGVEGYAAAVVANEVAKAKGIGTLRPPIKLQAIYAKYSDVLRTRAHQFNKVLAVLRVHRKPHVNAVQSVELQVAEHKLARSLKLTRC